MRSLDRPANHGRSAGRPVAAPRGRLPMRIILPMFLVLALLLPASASALTVQEVVALSQAGVSDEVLLTLIDRDKTIFAIGPDQLVALTRDNVSEKLVLAM